jgi:hypothetical protein
MLGFLGSAGLAGCTEIAGFLGSEMSARRITIADIGQISAGNPIELAVKMIDETATKDDPARVRVTLTNRADRSLDVSTGWPGVFGGLVSEETDPGLLLVHPEHAPVRNLQCLQPSRSYDIPTALWSTSLEPGTSESVTFEVWGQSDNDSSNCLPEGTFTFGTKYHVGPDDEETFRWGFSLGVELVE